MSVLFVEEMHCQHCSERISQALQAIGLKFSVDLSAKTVTVEGDEAALRQAVEELDDLGFSAVIKA